MANTQTVTSREFVHNVSAAKRTAAEGHTVIITDRGAPAFALLSYAEYQRLKRPRKNMAELLALPQADGLEFDIEPVTIGAQDLSA